jgi:transposase
MLIVGYCYGIRFERKLREEVELHLTYRWFCRLDLDAKVPDHATAVFATATFSVMCSRRVRACMDAGLVKGEGFAVDASVMEAGRQPVSWQGSRRDRLVGARAPDESGRRVPFGHR